MRLATTAALILMLAVACDARSADSPAPSQALSAVATPSAPGSSQEDSTPTGVPNVTPTAPSAIASLGPAVAEWFAQRPPIVNGRYATTDTSAYDLSFDRLSARPPVDPSIGLRLVDEYSYLAIRTPEGLASRSRLALRGRVVALGRPYFNSLDGSYWDSSFVGPDAGPSVPSEILRDVLFQVDEVLADTTGAAAPGELIEFTVLGGQVVVTITDTSNANPDEHPLGPGTFVMAHEPPVDLAVGEPVVLFLNVGKWYGLYADGGTKFGYIFKTMAAHGAYYKWSVSDSTARNDMLRVELSLDELRALVRSPHFASAVSTAIPDASIHPLPPHP